MISPKMLRDAAAKKIAGISTAKIYENTVIEKFTAPCVFIEIPKMDAVAFKGDTLLVSASLQITYFPPIEAGERVRSDRSTLCMMGKLIREFERFEVEDRVLTTGGVHFSFLGENTDVLQATIDLEYYDEISADDEGGEIIEEVHISE